MCTYCICIQRKKINYRTNIEITMISVYNILNKHYLSYMYALLKFKLNRIKENEISTHENIGTYDVPTYEMHFLSIIV